MALPEEPWPVEKDGTVTVPTSVCALLIAPAAEERGRWLASLRGAHVKVVEAATGDAVAHAIEYKPEVIIIAVEHRGCAAEGIVLTRWLRDDRRTDATSIIVLSADGEEDDDRRFEDAGADRLLPKSCSPEVLVHEVRRAIAARRRRAFGQLHVAR